MTAATPRIVFLSTVVGLALAGCATAQPAPSDAGADTSATVLADARTDVAGAPLAYPADGAAAVQALDVVFPPGARTGWHHHDVPLFNYVLEGALTVTYADGTERTYSAGETVMEAVGVAHWGRNDGTVPARLLTVVIGAENVPATTQMPDFSPPSE